ncbi:hypothetical protein BH11ACT4_BH11ACT4_24750 [soil metagenome]
MRALHSRLALLAAVILGLALAPDVSGLALVGVVALLSVAVLRVAVGVVGASEVTVGARARAHREVLSGMPAPRHPATAGRPMARAPGQPLPA